MFEELLNKHLQFFLVLKGQILGLIDQLILVIAYQ